ncbi:MAG TPA: ABC transporter ATP-binding protein, partial [Actinomycetes bacterium]|jgi:hypothetical protein|nr:ABC transporter ATP-binding protein [Actinomycetes bacterium]
VRTEHLGPEVLVSCAIDAPGYEVHDIPEAGRPGGGETTEGATLLARFSRGATVRRGEWVDLAVDVTQLCYFDPVSGAALWHPA